MYIEPFDDWHLHLEDYNISRLNFTWNCSKYELDEDGKFTTLFIDLVFNAPSDISPSIEQDYIFVNLTRAVEALYIQTLDGIQLRQEDYIMRKKVRLQMERSTASEDFI